MDPSTIKPALSPDPLRHRRDGEPWIEWAIEGYAHTCAELALTIPEWEALYGPHPGPGYTKVQQISKALQERDLRNYKP